MDMFCFQCSETLDGKACTVSGVCGKPPEVARLQDMLIWLLKGISFWAVKAREVGITDAKIDLYIAEGLFTTITNVNFDNERVEGLIEKGFKLRTIIENKFKATYREKHSRDFKESVPNAASWSPGNIMEKASEVGVMSTEDEDIRSLRELLIYGLKGIAAYTDHAYVLGKNNNEIFHFLEDAMASTLDNTKNTDYYLNMVIKAGEFAVKAMSLLDTANTSAYGNPVITQVYTGTVEGPGILVSGHDLLDLEELLKQTDGTGVNIYTHGEMLPANAYPELKKYKHLIGNFGTSWYNQQREFNEFEGPIIMTTNCIQRPSNTYKDRIFTTGLVAWPGIKHIPDRTNGGEKDFGPVIEMATKLGSLKVRHGKKITIGLAHNQVSELADKIVATIKAGKIKRFVVMAGCDGHMKERVYFTDIARKLPEDTVILTAGCAKYRYNMLELGTIDGIPRVVDAGQCNDSYSLVMTALKLKEAFGLADINELPISYDIAWYEQKAVCVLLALLYLGVKKIRLGPVLPAFVSPGVLKVLIEKFEIKPIENVENDIEMMMSGS